MNAVKKSIITKGVGRYKINRKINKTYIPKAGDVAVFKIIEIGKHKAIQGEKGTNYYLFPGDKILAVFGSRYATGQFEGYVPEKYHSIYEILGQGGVVGELASMHKKFENIGATTVKLVGYAMDNDNNVINTRYLNVERRSFSAAKPRSYQTFLSLGTSMDSGKTTTAAYLSRGLKLLKKKVAYIKLTGTVYGKDCSIVRDCGADTAVDFSYCGYPSTYMCSTDEILDVFETLLNRIERVHPDIVIVEIADGLLQRETKALLEHKPFMSVIDGAVLSCVDSLSTISGVEALSALHLMPFAICGSFTASPLLLEEARNALEIPILTLDEILTPKLLEMIIPKRRVIHKAV